MKIAIQGQQASFHDIAAQKYFGGEITIIPCSTFRSTFEALETGIADQAVVAVENSLYGPINPVYDLLLEKKPWVSGEIYLRIEHCLVGTVGSTLKDIREVHSQVMAIGQCEEWLQQNIPQAVHVEQHDTTASVVLVKEWNDPHKAAIASAEAAQLHGMHVIASNIEDHHQNFTRFFVLNPKKVTSPDKNKTSIILRTPADTKPGSLYRALGVFAKQNANIFSLQSRPIVGRAWHYMFYLDVGLADDTPIFLSALEELKSQGCDIEILGSYKNGIL